MERITADVEVFRLGVADLEGFAMDRGVVDP
jgi:hypothetical protein